MKYKLIILLFISLFVCSAGYTQVDSITWQKCLGTVDIDRSYGVIQTEDKYMFAFSVGAYDSSLTNYHGSSDTWIVCTDSIGNILWERCYGGSEGDAPDKIIKINNNYMYLLSFSTSTDGDVQNGRDGNFWIVKIDKNGEIIWENSYGNRSCSTRDAILTPDDGLLMMGRIMYAGGDVSTYYGRNDIWLCKIDSAGEIEWEKTLGNQGQDNALKIKLTSDNTILMVGAYRENGGMIDCEHMGTSAWTDVWIVELTLAGEVIRHLCYGGSYSDLGHDIIEVCDGYVVAASTTSNDGDVSGFHGIPGEIKHMDFWVFKINFNGEIIWQKCLGGVYGEYPVYITQTSDKGFIIMGNTSSNDGDVSGNHSNKGEYDIWIVKLSPGGELEWQHCIGGLNTEKFWGGHSVLKKSDYNYVIAGQSCTATYDVECDLYGIQDIDIWLFEIKDCSLYMPQTPIQPTGPDTLCYTTDSTSSYSISPAAKAWGYEWEIAPEEAGTLIEDSLSVYVSWNHQYEGEVEISARSYNDCGESEWSEAKKTWVYNCVGVEELSAGNIKMKVYPNPAGEKVVFQATSPPLIHPMGGNIVLEIRDVFGNPVAELKLKSEETVWDTKEIPAGVYIYTLKTNDQMISGKIVVR